MPHPLPPSARAWQEKVRRFVDEELIPFEVEAEMNGGVLPDAVRQRQRSRAKAIGLHALGIPKEHGLRPALPCPSTRSFDLNGRYLRSFTCRPATLICEISCRHFP